MVAPRGKRLTVAEAAQEIGVSEKRTRQLIKDGELPVYKPTERKTYVLRAGLDAFMSKHQNPQPMTPRVEPWEKGGLSRIRS